MSKAALNWSNEPAASIRKKLASAPSTSFVVVHSSAIGGWSFSRASTSVRIGPWIVDRIVMATSAPPATLIVSVRVTNGVDTFSYR